MALFMDEEKKQQSEECKIGDKIINTNNGNDAINTTQAYKYNRVV